MTTTTTNPVDTAMLLAEQAVNPGPMHLQLHNIPLVFRIAYVLMEARALAFDESGWGKAAGRCREEMILILQRGRAAR